MRQYNWKEAKLIVCEVCGTVLVDNTVQKDFLDTIMRYCHSNICKSSTRNFSPLAINFQEKKFIILDR